MTFATVPSGENNNEGECDVPDELEATPEAQPEELAPTPAESGPDSSSGGEQETESPSPSIEELRAQADRYKANAAGRAKEAERLKQELDYERQRYSQAQQILAQYQTQPQREAPKELNYADEEKEYQQALLESNYDRSAEILRRREARVAQMARQEIQSSLREQSQNMARLNSLQSFMVKKGLGDPQSPAFKDAQSRIQEAFRDPAYSFLPTQEAIAAVVAAEIHAERGTRLESAKERVKDEMANGSYTEGAAKGAGAPPGKKADSSRIYLTTEEREKMVRWYVKRDGISQAAAEKKYWEGLPANVREARSAAKRA